jgi:hypothetical protein
MLKFPPQRKGETRAQFEARRQKFAARLEARAAKTKDKLNARHAKGGNKFLADTTGVQRPAGFHPSIVPQKPFIVPPPAPKDRNSSHLRGLPPDDLLRKVRRRYNPPIRLGNTEEMVTIDRLMTTVHLIAVAQKGQRRARGERLDCKPLIKALGFLYGRRIPLRSHARSEAVREYARELAIDEPKLENPQDTARSRLRRLTDLRRRAGIPDPRPGRRPRQRK